MSSNTLNRAERLSLLASRLCDIPHSPETPHPAQRRFLLDFGLEALYGGAAGGGKSSAILMAALQFVEVPGYRALLLRRTYADLAQPGALMDRADDWFRGQGGRWNPQEHEWAFPSGGTVTFGYLERENDRLKYQGSEYQFIGFDELTQHRERDYRYLFSRLRRPADKPSLGKVPLRMRSTTNPGGPGHEWVHRRFVGPWEQWRAGKTPRPQSMFHPASLRDNPSLDYDEYVRSLSMLDPITRAQLLKGDWNIRPDGRMFKRSWFLPADPIQHRDEVLDMCPTVRYWDLAATDPKPGADPDWTVGVLMTRIPDGTFIVRDMVRLRATHHTIETTVLRTASRDGRRVAVWMEQEPGSSGKNMIANYRRTLAGWPFHGQLPSGKKEVRAAPVASQAEGGMLRYVPGDWVEAFIDEHDIFPDGEHDDIVDATSGAMSILAKRPYQRLEMGAINEGLGQLNPWVGMAHNGSASPTPSRPQENLLGW